MKKYFKGIVVKSVDVDVEAHINNFTDAWLTSQHKLVEHAFVKHMQGIFASSASDCGSPSGLPSTWRHNVEHGTWHLLEPNSYEDFAKANGKVTRHPIKDDREKCQCGSGSDLLGPGHSHWCQRLRA